MRMIRSCSSVPSAPWILAAGLVVAGFQTAAADSVTFVLRDLVFACTPGSNNLPNQVTVSEPGIDGHLKWTYPAGDFQSGTGTLLDLTLPFTTFPLSSAIITVDNAGITGAQPGNTHDLTYDFQISFSQALSSPSQSTTVNPSSSTFDFTGNWFYAPGLYFSGEWLGNITAGTISPEGSVLGAGAPAVASTHLSGASPNPFRSATEVSFSLAKPGPMDLALFGADGRRVASLAVGYRSAGSYRVRWDGDDDAGGRVRPGIYYARLNVNGEIFTTRIVCLR
jgi:hypothetical protein